MNSCSQRLAALPTPEIVSAAADSVAVDMEFVSAEDAPEVERELWSNDLFAPDSRASKNVLLKEGAQVDVPSFSWIGCRTCLT